MKQPWLVFSLLGSLVSCWPTGPKADLVLRGGRVYTVNGQAPWAEAVAIRNETLLAVGSDVEMDRFIGRGTVVVELGGRLVLPGFIDSHIHFLNGSLLLEQVQLNEAQDLEEMKAIVRIYAEAHPDLAWIVGMGWIYTHIDGGHRLPTRQDLDDVVPDRPVFLLAYDGHTAWVNSKALESAGIDRDSEPEGYGEIVKDPRTGQPIGTLKEEGAIQLVRRVIPRPSRNALLEALRNGMAYAHRFGITSIQTATGIPAEEDFLGFPEEDALDLFAELAHNRELKLRVYAAMSVGKETTEEDLDRFAELKARYEGPWLKAGAVKVFMDGVIETHTAAMLEPYSDRAGGERGAPDFTQAEIDELTLGLDGRGFQIFTHAIGDRAVRMVLNAYQEATAQSPDAARRHRIEHIEVISEEDIPRFAAVGVLAAMQPYHASTDVGGAWEKSVGSGRIERAFAWKSLRSAGARLVHGSDWPVVTIDPLVGIYAAVTREDLDHRPHGGWIPAQKLTLEEAVSGYTLDAAYASFEEDIKGSLEVGKLADVVVLSHDLFKVPLRKIAEAEVLMTVLGGETVYVSPRFLSNEMKKRLLSMSLRGER
jgi:predicted amidohydrolase YtcJ